MSTCEEIQDHIKNGDLAAAITSTKAAIRKAPTETQLRFMLFEVLSLAGDWEGASNQLVAFSELMGRQSPLPIVFNKVIEGEVRRKHVFLGEEAPTIFGEPPSWISYLTQAVSLIAHGKHGEATAMRTEAMSQAPALSGSINGAPFEWLMDGDSRLGVVFEAIMQGQYYWIPQYRIRNITLEAPTQIRDLVWSPATLEIENGAEISAFIPVRYPGAATWSSDILKLSKKTEWETAAESFYLGMGQKVFMTNDGEFPLLDVRQIEFHHA